MRCARVSLAVTILLTSMVVQATEESTEATFEPLEDVVAIDVLLELDGKAADMAQRAHAVGGVREDFVPSERCCDLSAR